ncbi:MAG: right-handed parallel beta-helix repeat-containing protein [Phycisphaerales bacterium]
MNQNRARGRVGACSVLVAGASVAFAVGASANVILVPSQQPTLKAAITAANSGDEIIVADGTYTGSDNRGLDFQGKNLFLHSANGASACTIDCQGAERAFNFQSGETAASVIEGFTIRNGKGVSGQARGGAISIHGQTLMTSPTIRHCNFESNTAPIGGAISVFLTSGAVITDCSFTSNSATSNGGGGIQIEGANVSVQVLQSTFQSNVSTGAAGGAIQSTSNAVLVVKDCTFTQNTTTSSGGAISQTSTTGVGATIWNCRFYSNVATSGSAILLFFAQNASIVNGVFSGNKSSAVPGAAISLSGTASATILNCTLTSNSNTSPSGGTAISKLSSNPCSVTNCIIWNNGNPAILDASSSNPMVVTNSIVQGGFPGSGNLNADPLFTDANGADNVVGTPDDDLSLAAGSLAIDSGNGTAWSVALTTDVLGNPRFVDDPSIPNGGVGTPPFLDRGAYEVQIARTCNAADIDCDGDVDASDLALLLGAWGSSNPDADLDGNGTVGASDLGVLLGAWTG